MDNVIEYMSAGHRQCDDVFINAEALVAKKDWLNATTQWRLFAADLEHHLQQEESILFPAFEQATGMTMGPTQVMRGEHVQMRQLVSQLTDALSGQDKEQYLGLSETLMILMQQHNMKEEQMLYPMTQSNLPNPAQTINEMVELARA